MGQNQMNVPNRGARPSSLALVSQTQPVVQQTAVMPTLNPSVGSPSVVAGYPRLNMVPEVPIVLHCSETTCVIMALVSGRLDC